MKELILKEIKVLEQDLASFFYMVPVYWSYGKVVWELAHNLYLAPTSCTVMRLGGDEMVAEYALPAAFAVVHAREQYARNNHRYESYDYTQAQFNHYTWFCGDFAACDLPKHLRTL
jgi:hypothetical protein